MYRKNHKTHLIVQCDGMADIAYSELNNKTPLEAAYTPTLDSIIKRTVIGTASIIPDKFDCGSYYGNLGLLGFDFDMPHNKLAPFLAKLNYCEFNENMYAIQCLLINIENAHIEKINNDLTQDEWKYLVEVLNNLDVIKKFKGTFFRYRDKNLLLLLDSPNIQAEFNDRFSLLGNNCGIAGKDAKILDNILLSINNAISKSNINEDRKKNGKREISSFLMQEGGYYWKFDNFSKRYNYEGTLIAGSEMIQEIGKLVSMKVLIPPFATGKEDTNLHQKALKTIEEIRNGTDFIFLHINLTDVYSHSGNIKKKKETIEHIDKEIISKIKADIIDTGHPISIMFTTDHYTYCSTKKHMRGNIPFMIYSDTIANHKNYTHFCEKACANSNFNFNSGKELMKYFMRI